MTIPAVSTDDEADVARVALSLEATEGQSCVPEIYGPPTSTRQKAHDGSPRKLQTSSPTVQPDPHFVGEKEVPPDTPELHHVHETSPYPSRDEGIQPVIVLMVGLPGSGKTFVAQKICRYLTWLGYSCRVYHLQRIHRRMCRDNKNPYILPNAPELKHGGHIFCDVNDPALFSAWKHTLEAVADQISEFLSPIQNKDDEESFVAPGVCAIVNDDFVSVEAREYAEIVFNRVLLPIRKQRGVSFFDGQGHLIQQKTFREGCVFVELVKSRPEPTEASCSTPPAAMYTPPGHPLGVEGDLLFHSKRAVQPLEISGEKDWLLRKSMLMYTQIVSSPDVPRRLIRIIDGDRIQVCGNLRGFIASKIVGCLTNLVVRLKEDHYPPIFFSRHGESEYNLENRLGGNPGLTSKGRDDAILLSRFVKKEILENKKLHSQCGIARDSEVPLDIWTSQLLRTAQTAQPSAALDSRIRVKQWSFLNEIHAGVCEDMTNEEVGDVYPEISLWRAQNKYTYRYPGGESYQDLMARLEPIIFELENIRKPTLVVAHQAVLRALLSYFSPSRADDSVTATVPQRTVWCCTYDHRGVPQLVEYHLHGKKRVDKTADAKTPETTVAALPDTAKEAK